MYILDTLFIGGQIDLPDQVHYMAFLPFNCLNFLSYLLYPLITLKVDASTQKGSTKYIIYQIFSLLDTQEDSKSRKVIKGYKR